MPEWIELVLQLARDAGAAIMQVYVQDFAVEHKDDKSPLTAADMAAHHLIVAGLQALTPDIPVLSEESAGIDWSVRRGWRRYWLVDPLDGTRVRLVSVGWCVFKGSQEVRIRVRVTKRQVKERNPLRREVANHS